MKKLPLVAFGAGLAAAVVVVSAQGGPPPFVSFPILMHVAENGLDHGHFVAGEDVGMPAPFANRLGTATAPAATQSSILLTSSPSGEMNVSNLSTSYEGETGGAANASYVVAGSNHIYPGACSANAAPGTTGDCAPLVYWANLNTSPTTWAKGALPRTWNGTTFGIGFDPSVDVDSAGTFYVSYGVAPLSGSYPNAIVVARVNVTSDSTATVGKLTPVTFNKSKSFDDKYYLAINRTNNRLYVSWDRNTANNQILYIAYSSDGGTTWSAPVKVDDGTTGTERVIGAYPAVDQASGVVYDSWHNYAKNRIYVDKSTTGGATWGQDVIAATTHTGFGTNIGCVGGRSQGPAHALKVGPSGTLYLVYADAVTGRGYDILFTKSTTGGASWSAPVALNDDTTATHQFQPTLSVESNGAGGDTVSVSFYDRRDDTASNCLSRVYATQSTDNGSTWTANVPLTSVGYSFDGNPNGPGDYSSSTPGGGLVWPFFSDRRSDFEVYTGKIW